MINGKEELQELEILDREGWLIWGKFGRNSISGRNSDEDDAIGGKGERKISRIVDV